MQDQQLLASQIPGSNTTPVFNIFILYHLYTRKTASDPIPPWCYLYGIVHSADGFQIYVHYPNFKNHGWGYKQVLFMDYQGLFTTRPMDKELRIRALANILTIHGHGQYVVRKLSEFQSGYDTFLAGIVSRGEQVGVSDHSLGGGLRNIQAEDGDT